MKRIKSIRFVFENCECFSIDAKYLGEFELSDIHKCIHRIAANCIAKMDCANTVAIEIFSEGNKEYSPFDVIRDEDETLFDRLNMYHDITSIDIIYDDDTSEMYYVDYEGDETNEYQKNYMNNFGDMYIVISKDKGIFDFFDEDEINDEEIISFAKDMIFRLEEK